MIEPKRFCSLCAAALGALLLAGCGDDEPPPEPVIRPVRYQQVYATGGERVRIFSGTAQASVESRLSFKVPGTVSRVAVEVGDEVKTGQAIAGLDDKDYQLQVEEAEAALASARAQARHAQATYARVRALYENSNASRSDLDAARAASESAGEQVKSVEKRLELARSQLSYTRLMAPVDGAIAAVRVEVNENVSPGQSVVTLTSGGRLEVQVAVPEVLIAPIREGDPVEVKFDALPGREMSGRVTEVGVAATGAATTFPVTVRLDHDDPDCRPGMAAEAGFRFGATGGRERMYVPPAAVGEDRQGRFVYVVEPTEEGFGQVLRREVRVGEIATEGLEIIEGLSDGELVVTAGVTRIVDGQKVRLLGAN